MDEYKKKCNFLTSENLKLREYEYKYKDLKAKIEKHSSQIKTSQSLINQYKPVVK